MISAYYVSDDPVKNGPLTPISLPFLSPVSAQLECGAPIHEWTAPIECAEIDVPPTKVGGILCRAFKRDPKVPEDLP
jgi:hypothetical protein